MLRDGDTVFVPRAETIYVFGEVKNPGTYPIQDHTTVLQALALAGEIGIRLREVQYHLVSSRLKLELIAHADVGGLLVSCFCSFEAEQQLHQLDLDREY